MIHGLCLLATSCQPESHEEAASATDTTAAFGHGAAHTSELEPRALLPIMQQLGVDMAALTHALMTDDYATLKQRADAVANHAPISAAELDRIHAVLGSDMAEFEQLDEEVHAASVRLNQAAGARDADAILHQLSQVQAGCVACHTRFRERLATQQ